MTITMVKKGVCPTCNGKKKHEMKFTEVSTDGVKHGSFEMNCMTCNATGEVSAERAKELRRMANAWCKCGNPSGNSSYWSLPGGTHGWDCADCHKLLQIG